VEGRSLPAPVLKPVDQTRPRRLHSVRRLRRISGKPQELGARVLPPQLQAGQSHAPQRKAAQSSAKQRKAMQSHAKRPFRHLHNFSPPGAHKNQVKNQVTASPRQSHLRVPKNGFPTKPNPARIFLRSGGEASPGRDRGPRIERLHIRHRTQR
jgi:hypothetical protein